MATLQSEDLFAPVLHSERLTLTLFNMNDKDDNDFMVMMFNAELPGAGPTDGNWTVKDVRRLSYSVMLKPSDANGRISKDAAIYVARLGDATGPPIGAINLCRRTPNVPLDIGFMIKPEHRKNGYATEAATRVLKYFKDEFGIKEICLVTDETNVPSKKIAGKLGLVDGGYVMYHGEKTLVFVLPGMNKMEGQLLTFWGDGEEPSV
ncbi:acyl-CoA N-acyltransferase [Trichoderma chlorosporum]